MTNSIRRNSSLSVSSNPACAVHLIHACAFHQIPRGLRFIKSCCLVQEFGRSLAGTDAPPHRTGGDSAHVSQLVLRDGLRYFSLARSRPEFPNQVGDERDPYLHADPFHRAAERVYVTRRIAIRQCRRHAIAQQLGHVRALMALIVQAHSLAAHRPPRARHNRSRAFAEVTRVLVKHYGQNSVCKQVVRGESRSKVPYPLAVRPPSRTVVRAIPAGLRHTSKDHGLGLERRIDRLEVRHFEFLPRPKGRHWNVRVMHGLEPGENQQNPLVVKRLIGERRIDFGLRDKRKRNEGRRSDENKEREGERRGSLFGQEVYL